MNRGRTGLLLILGVVPHLSIRMDFRLHIWWLRTTLGRARQAPLFPQLIQRFIDLALGLAQIDNPPLNLL